MTVLRPLLVLGLWLPAAACALESPAVTAVDLPAATAPQAANPPSQEGKEVVLASPLSLAEATQEVLQRNPRLQGAAARLAEAEAMVAASEAAFRPTLGFQASYLVADAPSTYLFKTIDARGLQPGTDFNAPGDFQNWEAGLGVGYTLYAGGMREQTQRMAKAQRRIQALGMEAARQALVAATRRSFFAMLAAREAVAVAESSVALVQAQVDALSAQVEEGRALKADLLSLKVRLGEAKEQRLAAQHGWEMARVAMATLLDLPPDRLPPLQQEAMDGYSASMPLSLEEALSLAARQRPELAQARQAVEQAKAGQLRAAGAMRPQVDLFGKAWADHPQLDFDGSQVNWSLGVALNWQLLDGGAREAQQAKANAGRLAMEAADRQAWLEVQADVHQAWLALEEACAREEVAKQAVTAAATAMELVRLQYDAGSATVTRFLEAEHMHTAAQVRRIQATASRWQAMAELQRAVGAEVESTR